MSYVIVIPAYNEERYLPNLLKDLLSVTKNIVIIDDGSKDLTGDMAATLGVPVITQPHQGKGAALRRGFRYAIEKGFDWVITMDSDGQHDWKDVPSFVEAMSRANGGGPDIIVGSRMRDASSMPVVRRLTNRFMSGLISRLSGSAIPDTQCGFRAISSRVLRSVVLETSHYDTESELLIKAGKAGFSIASVPIKTIYNGAPSNINKITDTARFLRLLMKTV